MKVKSKITAQDALKFFDDNYIMISTLETSLERGCTEKCLSMLKQAATHHTKKSDSNDVSHILSDLNNLSDYTQHVNNNLYRNIQDGSIHQDIGYIYETLRELTKLLHSTLEET